MIQASARSDVAWCYTHLLFVPQPPVDPEGDKRLAGFAQFPSTPTWLPVLAPADLAYCDNSMQPQYQSVNFDEANRTPAYHEAV